MSSNWAYDVIWYNGSNLSQFVDVTSDVISIPLFTDTGTTEINTATVNLSANNGNYIVNFPQIQQYDRIGITVIDGEGFSYSNVFEVIKIIPVETKTSGTTLQLTLAGLERHLQKKNYIKPWYYDNAFNVGSDILAYYNSNTGNLEPQMVNYNNPTNNQLPNFTVNIYNYGMNEDTCFNRLQDVLDKLGASVNEGGILDFFEMSFNSNQNNQTFITIKSSGSTTGYTPVIITDTLTVNVGETEGGLDAFEASNLCAWGADDQGSLPVDYSRFVSQQLQFPLYPTWSSTPSYPLGALVQFNGVVYQSLTNGNQNHQPPNASFWFPMSEETQFGNIITYSPWTRQKAQLWANSGSDIENNFFGPGFYDGNMVIWDDTTFRTWVHVKATDPTQIQLQPNFSKYLYNGLYFYRGFRCLINGIGTGQFAGNDVNGVSFSNSIAEFNGTNWSVLYPATTNMQCAIIYEGMTYAYNPNSPFNGWYDLYHQNVDFEAGPQTNGQDCFHPYHNIANVPGILGNEITGGDTDYTANTQSAVEVEYRWDLLDLSTKDANFYSIGAWLNFSFPFPTSTFGGITEQVGQLYGGAVQVGNNVDADREPATFDTQNMHITHDGHRGFNKSSSEDYGQIQSLDFIIRLKYESTDGLTDPNFLSATLPTGEANFNMRCLLYDTSDNVVYQDFIIPFNNNYTSISLPINNFQLYRARTPISNPFGSLIPPKALSPTNIFQWRNIKHVVIQTQDSYDNSGRYAPFNQNGIFNITRWYNPIQWDGIIPVPATLRRIQLRIDAFRFTKPLLTTTGPYTDRDIETDFLNLPTIGTYDQLKSAVISEGEKSRYQRIEYNLGTTGRFDIKQGQSFFYRNSRIVNFNDTAPDGISTNTVKLVAKRIEYGITKPVDGVGGFLRRITGLRRFTA